LFQTQWEEIAMARAQDSAKKQALIGWLSGSASKVAGLFADDFLDGMRDLGYVDGRDFGFVSHYAEGIQDRLPSLAKEIVGLKPDVIVADAVNAALPARAATSVIPIVCPALADAVHLGLIASVCLIVVTSQRLWHIEEMRACFVVCDRD
jgi:putative ABC transport system substrate-binding protein